MLLLHHINRPSTCDLDRSAFLKNLDNFDMKMILFLLLQSCRTIYDIYPRCPPFPPFPPPFPPPLPAAGIAWTAAKTAMKTTMITLKSIVN